MGKFKVYYYISSSGKNYIKDFLDKLSRRDQVKILRTINHLEEFENTIAIPNTKKLTGTDLWEIKIKTRNPRILYAFSLKESIVLLHGFIKKTQKTPRKEIKTALARLKDWLKMIDK